MTWELAESGRHFITSIINGADLVPSFSAASVDDLRSEVRHLWLAYVQSTLFDRVGQVSCYVPWQSSAKEMKFEIFWKKNESLSFPLWHVMCLIECLFCSSQFFIFCFSYAFRKLFDLVEKGILNLFILSDIFFSLLLPWSQRQHNLIVFRLILAVKSTLKFHSRMIDHATWILCYYKWKLAVQFKHALPHGIKHRSDRFW